MEQWYKTTVRGKEIDPNRAAEANAEWNRRGKCIHEETTREKDTEELVAPPGTRDHRGYRICRIYPLPLSLENHASRGAVGGTEG
jgi:hypothetical protein